MSTTRLSSGTALECGAASPVVYGLARSIVLITLAVLRPNHLGAQGALQGTVVSGVDNSSVPSAVVTLEAPRYKRHRIFSDSLGAFTISDLPRGTYSLRVQALEYESHNDTVRIENGGRVTVRIVLKGRCPYDSLAAQRDIAQNRPKIVERPSIAPHSLAPSDVAFQTKYGVDYVPLSDTDVVHHVCIDQYNRVVYRFLDEKYGAEWRRFVRTP